MADKGIRFEMGREECGDDHLVMGFIQHVDILRRKAISATPTRRSSPAWSQSAASST